MEAKVTREKLLEPLFLAQSVVERKTSMPILSQVCLKITGKKLELSATDLEVGLTTGTEIISGRDGQGLVNAKYLYEIVKEAPVGCEIVITQKEKGRVEVKAGASQYKLGTMEVAEFPEIPKIKSSDAVQIDGSVLDQMIDRVSYAISTDESRHNLMGVYLESRGQNTVRMVATDGHRLSIVDREVQGKFSANAGVIVPKKGIGGLKRMLADAASKKVDFCVEGQNAMVRTPSGDLVMRLVDGTFPSYEQVVPKKFTRTLTVPREGIMGALKRSMIFSVEKAGGVRLEMDKSSVKVSASSTELGESSEPVEAVLEGKPLSVGFNARYILDVLAVLADEKIVLQLGDEVSPCVLRSEFDRGFTAVVMPMKL